MTDEAVFPVTPGCQLRLETFSGAVRIVPQAEATAIRLRLHKEATGGRPGAAERWIEDVVISTVQTGNAVTIRITQRGSGIELDFGDRPTGSLQIDVAVPQETSLDLENRNGTIEVGNDLEGDVRARAYAGSLRFGRIVGSVEARVDQGDIIVGRATGRVVARTLRGDIQTGTLFQEASLETSSGNISVFSARRRIDAKAAAGDIDATIAAGLTEDSQLSTSGGNIRLAIEPNARVTVQARAGWGRIISKLDPTTRAHITRRSFDTQLNAGGTKLLVSASGGNVTLVSTGPVETDS